MRQTYVVKENAKSEGNFWSKRTGMEQSLLLITAFLFVLIVVLLIALRRDSAPLATEWGPVASWASVVVTFLGFVGAIAALRIQKTSVGIASEQHEKNKSKDDDDERAQAAAAEANTLAIKETFVRAVKVSVQANRRSPLAGHHSTQKQPFGVSCVVVIPPNIKFTNVKFNHPEAPEGFRVLDDTKSDTKFDTVRHGIRIVWHAEGNKWPHGSEDNAQAWAADQTSVTFTDPSGINWKIDGHGHITEITKNVEVELQS